MNKNKFLLSITSLATVGALLIPSAVAAYRGDSTQPGPNHSPDRYQAMTAAFTSNDYDAWRALMVNNRGRVTQLVNRDNFARFAEAHRLMNEGDVVAARQIRAELGLGQGMGRLK